MFHRTYAFAAIASFVCFAFIFTMRVANATEPKGRQANIREFLTLEGEFDLSAARRSGHEGALDISGFSLSLDPKVGIHASDESTARLEVEEGASGTGSWWPGFGLDFNSPPSALAVFGGDLYAGGLFTTIAGVTANRIARWDGSAWHAIGAGANAEVRDFAIWNNVLYVAGDFTTIAGVSASRIARFDGVTWSALGVGVSNSARAVAVYQNQLIVGGTFTMAGGNPVNRIAKWNGTTWSALGDGVSGTVGDLAAHGADLIAAGSFLLSGTLTVNRIARWDGSTWHALGTGASQTVEGVYSWEGDLFAGGPFTVMDGQTVNGIARWDGAWHPMLVGDDVGFSFGAAHSFGEFDGMLIVSGGYFTSGEHVLQGIGAWDGSTWHELGPGLVGQGPNIVYGSELMVAGGLIANGNLSNGMNRWDGERWLPLGPAVDDWVYAIEPYAGGYAVGGLFSSVDLISANSIGIWDGSGWTPLGTGIDGVVYAAAVIGGDLIVGGYFTNAGGTTANYVARWNGSTWNALGTGMNGMVRALTVHGGQLYAGGNFTVAGGVNANHIARWNGASWIVLGSGMNGVVYALESAGTLVAGGQFSTAGGSSADNLASWNGSSWSEYGGGTNGPVYALESFGGSVAAGGYFTTAGAQSVSNLASWNGSTWNSMAGGVNHVVRALDATASRLVAGGYFTVAGGASANFVVTWDGSVWRTLGTGATNGTNGEVRAITASDAELMVGGTFKQVNGRSSLHFARWIGDLPAPTGGPGVDPSGSSSSGSVAAFGSVDSANVTLLSFFPISDYDPWIADVWGYATEDAEYALVCQGNALTIVDVTDPENPVLASKVSSVGTDLKDCQTYGSYAYCVNQLGPMQVVDLSDPYDAFTVGLIGDHEGSHNCWIDTGRGLLYTASSRSRRGSEIYDLTVDPIDPPRISRHSYLDVHDVHARGDLAVMCNIGNDNYELVDVTDPTTPVLISRFLHDDPLAPHSAWMTPDQSIVYTCDERDGGGLHVFDISNPLTPVLVDTYNLGPETLIHDVHMQGDRLYISHYREGLRVLDASDPAHPYEIGHWTASEFESFGDWGVYPDAPSGNVYFGNMIGAGAGLYVARYTGNPVSVDPSRGRRRVDLVAWPNPMRERVQLRPVSHSVEGQDLIQGLHPIQIFDTSGRLVRRLQLGAQLPAAVEWDARDARGQRVPSGRYYLLWESENGKVTRAITVTR